MFSQHPFSTGSLWFEVRNFNIGELMVCGKSSKYFFYVNIVLNKA